LLSQVVALAFSQLTPSNLPRGSTLRSVVMKVTPLHGSGGGLAIDVRAALKCDGDNAVGRYDLVRADLKASSPAALIEWEVQPWDLGFGLDETPDLTALLAADVSSRDPALLAKCAIVITLDGVRGAGERLFYGPAYHALSLRPSLEVRFDPPSTAAQLAWTDDRSCPVQVAVPVPFGVNDACAASDAAARRPIDDSTRCSHLRLRALAATSTGSCAMSLNGLDLFSGCGLDQIVVGRDGVCAARVDDPNQPRAACFDTKTQGAGMEALASWIDALPHGATAMVVSCSRTAFKYSTAQLSAALRALGAKKPPTRTDDAYALIGVKGGSAPLSEAKTQCCDGDLCATCDQTLAVATADTACGAAISKNQRGSVLPRTVYAGADIGSEPFVAGVSAVAPKRPSSVAPVAQGPTSATTALASLQSADVDLLDTACPTLLAPGYGANLATDGDASTYWMHAGSPDAVLTLDLGFPRVVTGLELEWEIPAYTLLVLYSETVLTPDVWRVGAVVSNTGVVPYRVGMGEVGAATSNAASAGVRARFIRLYMRDAAAVPSSVAECARCTFALRELRASSCALGEANVTVGTLLSYRRTLTPVVQSIAPRRGSTAGGTDITLTVQGLPSGLTTSDVAVTVVGRPCTVLSMGTTEVVCRTSSYGITSASQPGDGLVVLTLPASGGGATTSNATYTYIDLWSRCKLPALACLEPSTQLEPPFPWPFLSLALIVWAGGTS
jgi:hypothetical protein